MTSHDRTGRKAPVHIRDARGRKVRQLDPVELHLLRRHAVIDADALGRIVDAVGSGLDERTRRFMPVLAVGLPLVGIVLIVQVIEMVVTGDARVLLSPRNIALANVWVLILILWTRAKQARFTRIRRIMLARHRCPHCGYDLRGLEPDASDGATVCPECGCAWRVDAGGRSPEG